MKTFIKNSVLVLLTICFYGCETYYYMPTKQNVLMFDKVNDGELSFTASPVYQQFGVEAGYAFKDNWGIISSFHKFDISNYGNTQQFVKDFMWDNELVYFKNWNKLTMSMNAGCGFGSYNLGNRYYKINLNRLAVLPSVGVNFSKSFGVALSSRLSLLTFNLKMLRESSYDEYDKEMFDFYFRTENLDINPHFLVEPAITLVFKTDFSKFFLQYSLISGAGKHDNFYSPDNLTFTWAINIGKLFLFPHSENGKLHWKF